MVIFLPWHPMEPIFLNSFVLLEHLAMLLTSPLAITCLLRNFWNKTISVINLQNLFLNCIDDTMIWYLNSKFDINLSCAKDFWNWILWWLSVNIEKIVGPNTFSVQFIKIVSQFKTIAYNINVLQQTAWLVVNPIVVGNFVFLFYCTRWVGLQTLWQFRLKDLSIDQMVGAWCSGCCQAHGDVQLDFFCSSIQFYELLSPNLCFISFLYLDLYVQGDDARIS